VSIPVLRVERHWACPNCTLTTVSRKATAHMPYHPCRGLHGLLAPMIPRGVRAEVIAVEREDYIGTEQVQLDPENGRPIMAVVTNRADGQDRIINAPVAVAVARVVS